MIWSIQAAPLQLRQLFRVFAATTGNKFVVLKGTSDTTGLALSSSSNNLFSTWSLQSATSGTDAYGNMITGNNVILTYTARTTDSMGLTNNQKKHNQQQHHGRRTDNDFNCYK